MAQHPILERYLWFDAQIRKGHYPGMVEENVRNARLKAESPFTDAR